MNRADANRTSGGEQLALPVQVNDRLQVMIKGTDEQVPTTYFSRVENIGDSFVIAWPTQGGTRAPIRDGTVLAVSFGTEDTIYTFDARILKRIQVPFPALVLATQGAVRRVQRREYVRVPAGVEVFLVARVVRVRPGSGGKADTNFITTRTVDLSGGGFGIHYPASLNVGDLYDVRLTIPGFAGGLAMTAKVVRSELTGNPMSQMFYDVGFAFLQIGEPVRRQIVSFVFRFQQKSRTG
jgi:c-di-GMP-binding flagellar brake protein YcgR